MPVTREDVVSALSVSDPRDLRAILDAARVPPRSAETSRELAERIADAIWWNYSTPAGYVANKTTLEQIVAHTSKRLRIKEAVTADDPWMGLQQMTVALAVQQGAVSIEDLDGDTQRRLSGSWLGAIGFSSAGAGSAGAGVVSHYILELAKTPVGRLLPFVPYVGPVWKGIKTGAGVMSLVSWPLTIAMGALAVNSSLGANYRRLVPLLLGVGALGPSAVEDAVVIDVQPAPQPA